MSFDRMILLVPPASRRLSRGRLGLAGCPTLLAQREGGDFDFAVVTSDLTPDYRLLTPGVPRHPLQIKPKEILRIRIQTNLRIHRPRFLPRESLLIHANMHPRHRTQLRPQRKHQSSSDQTSVGVSCPHK